MEYGKTIKKIKSQDTAIDNEKTKGWFGIMKYNIIICERFKRPFNRKYTYVFKLLENITTDKALIGFVKTPNLFYIELFYFRF